MYEIDYLFKTYRKDMYFYLYSLSKNQNISEDLTSEVFLSAIKSLPNFKGNSDIKTWLFSIGRYKWYEYIRREKKEKSLLETLEFYFNEKDYFQENYDENLSKRLFELLEKEPVRSKEILMMRLEGFSFHEISIKFSISENSARVIDFRTRKKLKNILIKEGYSYE